MDFFPLTRPAPPLPRLHLSEETVTEVASLIRTRLNALLSISQDIALGKDTKLFLKAAAYLLLISVVGGLTDFLTLGYASKFISFLQICSLFPNQIEREKEMTLSLVKGWTLWKSMHSSCSLYLCSPQLSLNLHIFMTGLLIVLTIPVLYERYEDYLDRYAEMVFKKSHQLYLKVDVECIGRVQNWILERQKLSWISFFFLWDLLCFVRYGAEECLGRAPWSMSFGCGRLLFFVLVLFWNNFFPLCTFIPSRSFSASIGAEETLYISEGNMAFLHSCYKHFNIFRIFVLALTLPTTIGFTKKNHFFRPCFESKSFFRGKKTSTPAFDSQLHVLAMQLAQNCSPKHNHNQLRAPTSSSIVQ